MMADIRRDYERNEIPSVTTEVTFCLRQDPGNQLEPICANVHSGFLCCSMARLVLVPW